MNLIHWHKNESNEIENRKARRAYETVLILAVKKPDTERYRHFSYQVNALQEGINHENDSIGKLVCIVDSINKLTFTLDWYIKVNPYVSTFYDAVLLYAYGLNRTIESNENASDGFAVVHKMWNVSFEGLLEEREKKKP